MIIMSYVRYILPMRYRQFENKYSRIKLNRAGQIDVQYFRLRRCITCIKFMTLQCQSYDKSTTIFY